MAFVAEATLEVDATREAVFDRLADHASWPSYMPASFRPAGRIVGKLAPGKRAWMKIAGAKVALPITITIVDRPARIRWTGGPRGLLFAEHDFYFDDLGGGRTRIRSVETWRGALTPFMKRFVKPTAERVGRDQLTAVASSLRERDA